MLCSQVRKSGSEEVGRTTIWRVGGAAAIKWPRRSPAWPCVVASADGGLGQQVGAGAGVGDREIFAAALCREAAGGDCRSRRQTCRGSCAKPSRGAERPVSVPRIPAPHPYIRTSKLSSTTSLHSQILTSSLSRIEKGGCQSPTPFPGSQGSNVPARASSVRLPSRLGSRLPRWRRAPGRGIRRS